MNIKYSSLNRVYINQNHIIGYDLISSDDRYQNIFKETVKELKVKGKATNFRIENGYLKGHSFKESCITPIYKDTVCVSSIENSATLYSILFELFEKEALLVNPYVVHSDTCTFEGEYIVPVYNLVFDDKKSSIYYKIKDNVFSIVSSSGKLQRNPFYVAIPKENSFSKGNYIKCVNINNIDYTLYLINDYGVLDDISYFDLNALIEYVKRDYQQCLLEYCCIQECAKYPLYNIFTEETYTQYKSVYFTGSVKNIHPEKHISNLKQLFFASLFLYRSNISKYYTED